MEKRKDAQQTMLSLNSEEGNLLTSQTDILEEVKNYFANHIILKTNFTAKSQSSNFGFKTKFQS